MVNNQQMYRSQVEGWLNDREIATGDEWVQFSSLTDFLNSEPYRKDAFNELYAKGHIEADERSDEVYVRWTNDQVENDDLVEDRMGLKGSRDYVNANHEKIPLLHVGEAEEHFEDHEEEYELQRFGIDGWEAVLAQWSSESEHKSFDLYVVNDEEKEEEEVRAYVSWKVPEWADKDDVLFPDKRRENYIRTIAEKRFEKLTERNIAKSLKDLTKVQLSFSEKDQS